MATTGLPAGSDADIARVTETLGMITPRWNVRILLTLGSGPLRYTEIADKMPWLLSGQLHPKLRALSDAGLAERTEHTSRHVTYGLTDRGTALLPVLPVIAAWAEEFLEKPDEPLSAIEHVEDSLTLLTRRHAAAILWVLKSRGESSARAVARIVMPDGYWTNIYPPLRQLADDGLVASAGPGQPYRLSTSGEGLGRVFGALSAWSAGRSLDSSAQHPVWGNADRASRTAPKHWTSHQPRISQPAVPTRPARPAYGDLFSHANPARLQTALRAGGARR